jgi:hypothetical protein
MLKVQPIKFDEACAFIRAHHRHHIPPQGWMFGVSVADEARVVGVVTIGRPVARRFDDGWTLEVTRLCTDGTKNASSMLYGAAYRAAKALGYRRIITYTLESEIGTSLKASGWREVHRTSGGSWDRSSRPRTVKAPITRKTLWEANP